MDGCLSRLIAELDWGIAMNLGDLIIWLQAQDPQDTVRHGFGKPDSFRGYYGDVAFTPVENTTFGEMLDHAQSALGKTFHGYKGGDYTMYEYTACWISEYGTSCNADKIGNTILKLWLLTAK